jgi:hypothetical protein
MLIEGMIKNCHISQQAITNETGVPSERVMAIVADRRH